MALDVLDACLDEFRPRSAEAVYLNHPALPGLEPRDRAFARALYSTALRRLGECDALLRQHLKQKPPPSALNVLRLGVTQLLALNTPPHAAVAETVSLAAATSPFAKGMVNAVLRRVQASLPGAAQALEALSLNTPEWLRAGWLEAYGAKALNGILSAHMLAPPLDLRAKSDPRAWAERLSAELLPGGTLRLQGAGAIEALEGYAEGAWWVQDAAASLPARMLGDVRGLRVLDLCAAPGGKTAQLAAAGADVTAVEFSSDRVSVLRANLERLRLHAEVVEANALNWTPAEPFPAVLLDAPCTATGTIRRHPDIAWSKTPDDVERLAEAQAKLLERAAGFTAPGGVLVYAVCSLQPEEGPEQVRRLLSRRRDLRLDPVPEDGAAWPVEPGPDGQLRTLPGDLADTGGMDGFYAARLVKKP